MMPDLDRYAGTVLGAYGLTIGLLLCLVLASLVGLSITHAQSAEDYVSIGRDVSAADSFDMVIAQERAATGETRAVTVIPIDSANTWQSKRGDAQVTTWLHRIIVNSSLDRLRRLKPTQEWPEYDIADKRDEHAQTDVRLDVRQALAQLPEGQRLCLVLVDMEGLSVTEAATHLGIAEGTVKSRCARGRTALAGMLADR